MLAHDRLQPHTQLQLTAGKVQAIIAVPNAILMANHQAELARHLESLGHLVSCTTDALAATLQTADLAGLQPYQPGDPSGIVRHIHALVASRR